MKSFHHVAMLAIGAVIGAGIFGAIGTAAAGQIGPDGIFRAREVLAKHDENYMPRDLANSLKEKGVKLGKGAGE